MNQLLKSGGTVQMDHGGLPCQVREFLGGGGQGEVYRAELSGGVVALKWYFPQTATADQRNALAELVRLGPPTDRFLWPVGLCRSKDLPGFGYVMQLRDSRYKSIVDLMKLRVDPSFATLAITGMELADSFQHLHAKGLCYRDISFGNVFFDPSNGHVLICDNDNVAIDGAQVASVLGTPGFMAPEIVCRTARPDTQTDLYSLAVLLFYLLTVSHPLDGAKEASIKCLDLPARERLYGSEALFIFDPRDDRNRPVPGLHDNAIKNWPLLPRSTQGLFTRAFTEGIRDRDARVRETEWRKEMAALRDSIFYCGACSAESFYDPLALKEHNGDPGQCWHCQRPLQLPPRMRLEKQIVLLNHDTKLYPHHLDPHRAYDFSAPQAEVVRHPQTGQWGLRNHSERAWSVTLANSEVRLVEPGKAMALAVGARINFGEIEGEIRIE
jgi:serine/threonine protein kinase